jgi:hypothetical protein
VADGAATGGRAFGARPGSAGSAIGVAGGRGADARAVDSKKNGPGEFPRFFAVFSAIFRVGFGSGASGRGKGRGLDGGDRRRRGPRRRGERGC